MQVSGPGGHVNTGIDWHFAETGGREILDDFPDLKSTAKSSFVPVRNVAILEVEIYVRQNAFARGRFYAETIERILTRRYGCRCPLKRR
jgi:hypothetical protein